LTIGNNTRINGADFNVHNGTKIEIGSGCLFSTNIDVRTTDSHNIFNFDGERINPDKNIHIGEHVWIGRMVSILKGAKIGNGSVIGSMSLVSGIIPNEVIPAGVPAKTIKENITWKE
ncbi:acyltransferase, partial [Flavobacterium cellulosilyticum]